MEKAYHGQLLMDAWKFNDFSSTIDLRITISGFDDEDVQTYYNFAVKSAILFGAEESRAKRELEEAVKFELKLAGVKIHTRNTLTIRQII